MKFFFNVFLLLCASAEVDLYKINYKKKYKPMFPSAFYQKEYWSKEYYFMLAKYEKINDMEAS